MLSSPRTTTSYRLAGTKFFRLSSGKLFKRYGGNHQNIPKALRQIYIPDEGNTFVQVDQAGAEALIVAYLCRPGRFRDLFTYKVKPHVYVALHLFKDFWRQTHSSWVDAACYSGIAGLASLDGWRGLETTIKYHDRYYAIGKMVCHASNYAMKGPTFALNVLQRTEGRIRLSVKEADQFLAMYHGLFPEIRQWHLETVETLSKNNRTLRNLFGFPCQFTGIWGESLFKEAYSFVPQSTVGCITHFAVTRMQDYIERHQRRWDLLNNCHDSYLLQCPHEEKLECALKAREFMEQPLVSLRGESFQMKSEVQTGLNWGPYNTTDNPLGLQELKF